MRSRGRPGTFPYFRHKYSMLPQAKRSSHSVSYAIAAGHSFTLLSLSALLITDTELKLMAAAAMMGLSNIPNLGYRMPAAMGTPTEL